MPLNFKFIWNRMLLFYIIFGDRNPPYPALGFNIPSARRPGQQFHFLQCTGSSPSLRFVDRHWGTLRRAGWVAKTYSRGKFTSDFCNNHSRPGFPTSHVPASPSHTSPRPILYASPSSLVPKSQVPTHASRCPCPLVPVPLLHTAFLHLNVLIASEESL